ncbi:hypothetical protein Arub01_10110 [Actinomadura rubrobrunea]|uniref:Uncharacterized protein n=1 Tax=Actinomadura rubrobrunea TaxID=115335 RepID=A0A9W6PSN8_9ACTN|nr:hypothetical protein Arub01_10110 [Actinomadura rubrobrunea]
MLPGFHGVSAEGLTGSGAISSLRRIRRGRPPEIIETQGVRWRENRVTAERGVDMTPTTRWVAAQRRKRQIISQTVLDRALRDPRRRREHPPVRRPAR